MYGPMRPLLAIGGVVNLSLAVGFAWQQPWALQLWPWETTRLSYVFLASMLTAVGAAALWIAYSGETGSLPAGFLNLAVTLGGVAVFVVLRGTQPGGSAGLVFVVVALAVVNALLFAWTRRLPQPGAPPLPKLVRGSYAAFTAILAVVGIALILQVPGIMPWPVDPDTSVLFGCIFFGDAWYFAYAVRTSRWDSARAQLWSFLGYDVVLFGPLLWHLIDAPPQLRRNTVVYLAVLTYSAGLAIYYLILNQRTRGWGSAHARR